VSESAAERDDFETVRAELVVGRCAWHDPHSCSMMQHDPDEPTEGEAALSRIHTDAVARPTYAQVDSMLLNIIGLAVTTHFNDDADPEHLLDAISNYAEACRTQLRDVYTATQPDRKVSTSSERSGNE